MGVVVGIVVINEIFWVKVFIFSDISIWKSDDFSNIGNIYWILNGWVFVFVFIVDKLIRVVISIFSVIRVLEIEDYICSWIEYINGCVYIWINVIWFIRYKVVFVIFEIVCFVRIIEGDDFFIFSKYINRVLFVGIWVIFFVVF